MRICRGVEVEHAKFGAGIVLSTDADRLVIRFPDGERKFISEIALRYITSARAKPVAAQDLVREQHRAYQPIVGLPGQRNEAVTVAAVVDAMLHMSPPEAAQHLRCSQALLYKRLRDLKKGDPVEWRRVDDLRHLCSCGGRRFPRREKCRECMAPVYKARYRAKQVKERRVAHELRDEAGSAKHAS